MTWVLHCSLVEFRLLIMFATGGAATVVSAALAIAKLQLPSVSRFAMCFIFTDGSNI